MDTEPKINPQPIEPTNQATAVEKNPSGMLTQLSKKKFPILFVALFLITAGAITLKMYHPTQKQTPQVVQKTIIKQEVVRRSKDNGIINKGLTGKAIDVNTGKIINAARVFSTQDKTVYLELDFNSAPKGTVIDYIRYKKGRYVDHGEIITPKDNVANVLFNWSINNVLANLTEGQWRVTTYANGILAKRINYEIKNNKVAYSEEEIVKPTDPDYTLKNALAANSR